MGFFCHTCRMTASLRVLRPHPNIYAFYDGRIEGQRFAAADNWVDDGALSLGIASYAVVDGEEAVIYDTHVSIENAARIREILHELGVKTFIVVLSHWHLDHVAGTKAFDDCRIISNERTSDHLKRNQAAIEDGKYNGPPTINPLILPIETFKEHMVLRVGGLDLQLIQANIHSDDATVIWIEKLGVLLAGDTMEDTVTYVSEPQNLDVHLSELDRLWKLQPTHILPNHGDPEIIALGGYEKTLIRATQQYIRMLMRCVQDPDLREKKLDELIAGPLQMGWVHLFGPYEKVHQKNLNKAITAALN